MSRKYLKYDLTQSYILPPNPKDWLPDDHLAHFIVDMIKELDIQEIYDYYDKATAGAPPFDPTMMVSILLYAYCVGIQSSRRIEKAIEEDVAFRYLAGGQLPDFRTICVFRTTHSKALEGLFKQVLLICQESGLVKMKNVAGDGTKIKANASMKANRTYERLVEEEKKLEQDIRDNLKHAVKLDEEEDRIYGNDRRGDELPKHLQSKNGRVKAIKRAKKALEDRAKQKANKQRKKIDNRNKRESESGKKIRGRKPNPPDDSVPADKKTNTTDPDSRIMKTQKGFVQGYNGQAMVDCETQIIVAQHLTNDENDKNQMNKLLNGAIVNTGNVPQNGIFDAGYWSEENINEAHIGVDLFVATQKDWKERNEFTTLPPPRGRIPVSITTKERMNRKLRTKKGRKIYKLRGQTIEPTFGQIKSARNLDHFLMRGTKKASLEWSIYCTTHNILKLWRSGSYKHANNNSNSINT